MTSRIKNTTYILALLVLTACASNGGFYPGGGRGAHQRAMMELDFLEDTTINETEPPKNALLKLEAKAHLSQVRRICKDTNNKYLLTAGRDKTLRLWDRSNGELLDIYRVPAGRGKDGQMFACAISPDGNTIYGAGWTGWDWNKSASIYVFDRVSGTMKTRVKGIDQVVIDLDISKDGRYLAAGLANSGGIRVWSIADNYRLVAEDKDYNDKVSSVTFDRNGRIAATSFDGFLRLYDAQFKLIQKKEYQDGARLRHADFSPDGSKIALVFFDSMKVSIVDAATLKPLYHADTSNLEQWFFNSVVWSLDGQSLYSGGAARNGNKQRIIRRWENQGKGAYRDFQTTALPVMSIVALDHDEIAYVSMDPVIQVLNKFGKPKFTIGGDKADYRGLRNLRVSYDGKQVQFGYRFFQEPANIRFDLTRGKVLFNQDTSGVSLATRRTPDIKVKRWKRKFNPIYRGSSLVNNPYDRSRAVAVMPDESGFVLALTHTVRMFDSTGNQLWRTNNPGVAWNANISGNGEVVVIPYADGTIRWYRVEDGKELLAFFPFNHAREWIAWTPHGFFDASPGAAKHIGFLLNHGQDTAPSFINIDQLYDYFYRPDLVAKALDIGAQPVLDAAMAKVDIDTILYGGLPPQITLLGVRDDKVTKNGELPLKVCIKNQGGGVGKVIYRVNNMTLGVEDLSTRALVRNEKALQAKCDQVLNNTLVLEPGVNKVSISAFNKDNTIESRHALASVTFHGKPTGKPNLHVIAVGINDYRDSALHLKYSVPDANAFIDVIEKSAKGLFRNIVVHKVLDGDATIKSLAGVFKQVASSVKGDDVFLFYVAAHGITLNGRYYIVPQDLVFQNEDSVIQHGLNQDLLQKWLASVPARKSVVLLDTCNSGAFTNVASRGLAEKTAINKLMRATGRVTIAASAGNQEALEGYQGHGVFTYVLLQAFSGVADSKGNGDGQITVNELAEFVGDQVPRITKKKWGKEQFPMQSLQGRSFPIGLLPKQ